MTREESILATHNLIRVLYNARRMNIPVLNSTIPSSLHSCILLIYGSNPVLKSVREHTYLEWYHYLLLTVHFSLKELGHPSMCSSHVILHTCSSVVLISGFGAMIKVLCT